MENKNAFSYNYLNALPLGSRRTQFTKPKIPEYSTPWLTKSICLFSFSDCWNADLNVSIQAKSLPVQLTTIGADKSTFYKIKHTLK